MNIWKMLNIVCALNKRFLNYLTKKKTKKTKQVAFFEATRKDNVPKN